MTGIIVRNQYLYTEKFSAHVAAFEEAFRGAGAEIFTFSNADFSVSVEKSVKIALNSLEKSQKIEENDAKNALITPENAVFDLKNTIKSVENPQKTREKGAENAVFDGFSEKPSFVLFWDKDIALAKCLEACGLKLFNCAECISICDSKIFTHIALAKNGIPTPLTTFTPFTYANIGFDSRAEAERVESVLSYPLVAKSDKGSFGQQVGLVRNREELIAAIDNGATLFQEFLDGEDIRVNVVGDKVVSAVSRKNEKDFRKNATIGGEMKNYPADSELSAIALSAARAVGADFCGVDILKCADGYRVLEVNSNAHFLNALEATGDNMAKHIARYVVDFANGLKK